MKKLNDIMGIEQVETLFNRKGTVEVTENKVYVDNAFIKFKGMKMSHIYSPNLQLLHEMADTVGLKREWFQNKGRYPHYDLSKGKREQAIINGAIPVTCQQLIRIINRFEK